MPASDVLSLDSISVLLIWTAIAIYAIAFVAYAADLAKRSADAAGAVNTAAGQPAERELAGAAVAVGGGAPGVRGGRASRNASAAEIETQERAAEAELNAPMGQRGRFVFARIGTMLTVLAVLFHLAAAITRGIAAERVPWSNMYEFAMTGTLLIVVVYLAVLIRFDLRFLGTFITGLIVVLLGGATLGFYVEVVPLMDSLKSVWLVIHVFVASLATAFLALAFALSVLQLLQASREVRAATAGEAPRRGFGFLRLVPSAESLENLAYRFAIIGFIFWTFTLIAGAIWAQDAWGRYWGFDTKEVWTFVIWVLYAGYIHARATRGWRGNRSAWLSIVGFAAVMFNFTIVNMFFKGLHAYSGLS